MGRRGPPPKPATQKMRERTYAPGRDGVTPVADGVIVKPDNLGEYGSKHWDNVIGFVVEMAGGGVCDTDSLTECCHCFQTYRELRELAAQGEPGTTEWKRVWDTAMRQHDTWARWASKFGFTPADRASIKQQVSDDSDPLEGMLSKPQLANIG